jgi:hypothetical protein
MSEQPPEPPITCNKCGIEQDADCFEIRRDRGKRRQPCRKCIYKRKMERYAEQPELRERALNRTADWRKAHREDQRIYFEQYRDLHHPDRKRRGPYGPRKPRKPREPRKLKLSDAQVIEVRAALDQGARPADLARQYKVTIGYISRIKLGTARTTVTAPEE